MLFDRRLAQNFDIILAGIVLLLMTVGVMNIYSAALNIRAGVTPIYMKQLTWAAAGIVLMVFFVILDYRLIQRASYPVYALTLVLLTVTPFIGKAPTGAVRWIDIGIISFQPSEISKLALVLGLARYFDIHWHPEGFALRQLIVPLILIAVPAVLIMKQPDLGTSLLVLMIGFSMAFFARIRTGSLLILAGGASASLPLSWYMMKAYQRRRLLAFLNPSEDPLGSGYHQLQSKIAVGSGRFLGKGFLKGTQTQLHFLPEQHTDFAFSVWAEEWGFIGSVILLGAFAYLVIKGLDIAAHARDRHGMLLAVGITAIIFWQVFMNIGMVTGLLPVVGVPLPFISYGGSSLLTLSVEVGILMGVGVRRHMFS